MFDVLLGDLRVGTLRQEEGTGVVSFILEESYASMPGRPVLGQQFEERRLHRAFRQAAHPGQLPSFFANLLPEGALGAMVSAQIPSADKVAVLAIVGEDLPGAVIVRPTSGGTPVSVPPRTRSFDEPGVPAVATDEALRFSLAGVQLKFSAVASDDNRFTLPFRGIGGRWILKFGSETYPKLPENEFLTMEWASAAGLDVPAHRLIPVGDIDGLDPRFAALGEHVYAIERYDRRADGSRVHQEDFAQVRGVPPEPPALKYSGASLEGLARFIGDLCGPEDLKEFLHRVLFLLLCGNTDAHLKNWSLLYPDGRAARLAPVYDFVCVLQYLPADALALPLAKEKSLERIGWEHVARAEKFLRDHGHDTELVKSGREFVRRCMDEWATLRQQAGPEQRAALDSHHARLPLVRDLG